MKISFSELILLQSMNRCLDFSFSQPKTYAMIVLRAVTDDATQAKVFHKVYCELETYALVYLPLQEAAVFVHRRVL